MYTPDQYHVRNAPGGIDTDRLCHVVHEAGKDILADLDERGRELRDADGGAWWPCIELTPFGDNVVHYIIEADGFVVEDTVRTIEYGGSKSRFRYSVHVE
ncbi:hypothetical protein [Halosegnis longus]|uniref:hypothetical protein n=1 Tax=Halosegnis longus TaxID=2216012 RepID=UPI00129DFC37|nr:hypothetical protein [Halosegnis longus]